MGNGNGIGGWSERVQAWWGRAKGECPCRRYGAAIGVLLIVFGTVLLFRNESETIRQASQPAEKTTTETTADGAKPAALTVPHSPEILDDPLFEVECSDTLRLERRVQYYQYVEVTKASGEYEYRPQWVNKPIDASKFNTEGHECPPIAALGETVTVRATEARLGKLPLPMEFVESQKEFSPVSLAHLTPERLQKAAASLKWNGNQAAPYPVHVAKMPTDDEIFFGADPAKPAVGDVRVSFAAVPMSGVKFTGTYASLPEQAAAAELAPPSSKRLKAWVMIVIGWLVTAGGLALLWERLVVWGESVPLIKATLGAGCGWAGLMAGGAWTLLVIAVARLLYTPWISLGCIVCAAALLLLLRRRAAAKTA